MKNNPPTYTVAISVSVDGTDIDSREASTVLRAELRQFKDPADARAFVHHIMRTNEKPSKGPRKPQWYD